MIDIDARVTLYVDEDGARLEIVDESSTVRFLELKMSAAQFCSLIGRSGRLPVEQCRLYGLERVGKVMEHDYLTFPLPKDTTKWAPRSYDRDLAVVTAPKYCPEGWTPETSYNSQNSFFTKDGEPWARTIIRRWVDKPGSGESVEE